MAKEEKPEDKAPAKETAPEDAAAGAKKKRLIIIGAAAFVLVAGAAGAAAFLLGSGGAANSPKTDHADSKDAHGDKHDAKPAEGGHDGKKDEHGKADGHGEKKDEHGGGGHEKKDEHGKADGHGEKKDDHGEHKAAEAKDGKSAKVEGVDFGCTKGLPAFHLNLGNPLENRYLRLEVSVEYACAGNPDNDTGKELDLRKAQLRDAIISVASRKTREFLLGPDGKEQLRKEIHDRVNQYMKNKIDDVYITDILIE